MARLRLYNHFQSPQTGQEGRGLIYRARRSPLGYLLHPNRSSGYALRSVTHMQPGKDDDLNALVGKSLNQFRIVERIGAGGMATVFKAYQPTLDRYVAVKVLPAYHAR